MPRTHAVPPVAAQDLDAALGALRASGMRASAARRLVLEVLHAASTPLTAEQIADGLGGRVPRSDLASVYRNLGVLERAGLAQHVHLGHGPALYSRAIADPPEYARCDGCGAVVAIGPEAVARIRATIRSELGYEARFAHVPLTGLCPDCAPPD